MKIQIVSVGRTKSGPEPDLIEDYATRFRKTGQHLGFRGLDLIDVESGGGLEAEGARLEAKVPSGASVFRLDENGEGLASVQFSKQLQKLRDTGVSDLTFLIGGAAGYAKEIEAAYPRTLAFGPQTWPHRLVKVMLTEQLYRAASIEAGTPYHKA